MHLNTHAVFFFFAYILSTPANAGWFGPDDYDECILEAMQGVKSDVAAYAIRRSCRDKFPKDVKTQEKETRALTKQELNRITGTASSPMSTLYVTAYNGNTSITVSELTVGYTKTLKGKESTIRLKMKGNIAPLTSNRLTGTVPDGEMKNWWIASGRGY